MSSRQEPTRGHIDFGAGYGKDVRFIPLPTNPGIKLTQRKRRIWTGLTLKHRRGFHLRITAVEKRLALLLLCVSEVLRTWLASVSPPLS